MESYSNSWISIHLMLLFNFCTFRYINYIKIYFNTSNVTIQLLSNIILNNSAVISIHLMLLFNCFLCSFRILLRYFNTSNVTIQQQLTSQNHSWIVISIHLMLLFNVLYFVSLKSTVIISIHLMLLFNHSVICCKCRCCHFNTSNVTIQLIHYFSYIIISLSFQYI